VLIKPNRTKEEAGALPYQCSAKGKKEHAGDEVHHSLLPWRKAVVQDRHDDMCFVKQGISSAQQTIGEKRELHCLMRPKGGTAKEAPEYDLDEKDAYYGQEQLVKDPGYPLIQSIDKSKQLFSFCLQLVVPAY